MTPDSFRFIVWRRSQPLPVVRDGVGGGDVLEPPPTRGRPTVSSLRPGLGAPAAPGVS
jgi:hypothetical protein